jgi:YesN/AraC family two-component response regulator
MMKVKILIVDDHPIFRQGLVKSVEQIEEFEIVGEVGDGRKALDVIETRIPDIVVVDISMPSMTGFDSSAAHKINIRI